VGSMLEQRRPNPHAISVMGQAQIMLCSKLVSCVAYLITRHYHQLGPSNSVNAAGMGSSLPPICPNDACSNDGRACLGTGCALLGRLGSCDASVSEECYLVDPASSHMLVSKINPCMC
ncbi:hypothetical protein HAX54_039775, partial [Datura stramonium]|nr:hypothetical protein [Datura stramonium]